MIGILSGYEDWFLPYTPFTLFLCLLFILFNTNQLSLRDVSYLLIPFSIGFVAELLGVNFGLIFGNYHYGNNLGWKIAGVPVMIGINWIILVYASSGISKWVTHHRWLSSILAASLMVLLDVPMEFAAPKFDFWAFAYLKVPVQNYVGWFAVSLLIHYFFQPLFQKEQKYLSLHLYLAIAYFFLSYYLFCSAQ
jgi:putative membrane protein